MFEYFVVSVAGMFVIVNPLTAAFVFASLTPTLEEDERRGIARRAVVTSTATLFTFALLGSLIFQLFGITLAAFRIAGGLILFTMAMGMLTRSEAADRSKEEVKATRAIDDDIAIIPLSIPFISGPGAIATAMILTSEAPGRAYVPIVFFAILVTTVACYYTMVNSRHVIRIMGESGRRVLTKLFGLILAVIAVQFVINGASNAVTEYLVQSGLNDAL